MRVDFTSPPEDRSNSHRTGLDAISVTPGFVFDERRLNQNLSLLNAVQSVSGCRILYSIKACPFTGLLKRMYHKVDGFSVSSLFEARLATEVLAGRGSLHITTPGLLRDELPEIADLCDFVSFNSLSQLERFTFLLGGRASIGVRINPQLSFLDDPRYDPCRIHSKLGVPLSQAIEQWSCAKRASASVTGLHLHTNFSSPVFTPLKTTVAHLEAHLPEMVDQLEWVNLGGGYLFQASNDLQTLYSIIDRIHTGWGAQVYLEPGKSVVDDTGLLVTSVIDTFESDGKQIAVLDTTVNHLPEAFEYQRSPRLLNDQPHGAYTAILAGSTCLSGDIFGEYRFSRPLEINDRLVFEEVGAYSLIKASRFNGYNLPSIHLLDEQGGTRVMKTYDYNDYRSQWSEIEATHHGAKQGAG
jgi:carboxynorspermidine decarboxylase